MKILKADIVTVRLRISASNSGLQNPFSYEI